MRLRGQGKKPTERQQADQRIASYISITLLQTFFLGTISVNAPPEHSYQVASVMLFPEDVMLTNLFLKGGLFKDYRSRGTEYQRCPCFYLNQWQTTR